MRTTKDTAAGTLHRLCRSGLLVRALPGIYLEVDEAQDFGSRCAAVGAWDRDAIITHRAAAKLSFWSNLSVPSIAVSTRRRLTAPGYDFSHSRYPLECIAEVGGMRFTQPAITALELADATHGDSIDAVLRSRMATLEQLHEAMSRLPARAGKTSARRYLRQSRDNPWSAAERRAHLHLHRHRIEGWEANWLVKGKDQMFYVDIAFPLLRIAIEIDGWEYHKDYGSFVSDRRRHNELTLLGWTVLRFPAADILQGAECFVRTILQLIREKTYLDQTLNHSKAGLRGRSR